MCLNKYKNKYFALPIFLHYTYISIAIIRFISETNYEAIDQKLEK